MNRLLLISTIIVLLLSYITLQAQKANLDSLNRVVNENHLAGLELIKRGNKTEGIKKFYTAVDAFREIDYELAEERDSVKNVISGWLKDKPESPFYSYLMGNIIYLTKRDSAGLALAKEYYNKSISLEPNFIHPYRGLAGIAQLENDSESAINYYKKAIEVDSTSYSTYLRLAPLLKNAGKTEEAIKLFEKIIAKDSSSYNKVWAYVNLANSKKTFDEKNDLYTFALKVAREQIDTVIVYQAALRTYYTLSADSYYVFSNKFLNSTAGKIRQLRTQELRAYFNKLTKNHTERILSFANTYINENNPPFLMMLGSHFSRKEKDYVNSLRFLERAYAITDSESVYETILFGKKDYSQLKKIAEGFKYGQISTELGFSHLALKNYSIAEKYLKDALPYAEEQRTPDAFYLMSKVKKEQKNIDEAIKLLVKGLSIKDKPEERKNLEEMIVNNNLKSNADQLIKEAKMADQLVKEVRTQNAVVAIDFMLSTLDGKKFKLSEQKGKVVVLDFWATWCGPCVAELPHLVKLQEKYSNNPSVVFQGIDTDETPQVIKDFMKKNGYSFNVLTAVGTTVSKDYGVTAIPTMFIIDKQGRIQFKHIGFDSKENIVESLSKEIDELLSVN